jgi:hypothetical protein
LLSLDRVGWLIVSAAWLLGSFGSGALLALLYKRLHPELSYHRLWAFWTVVVSVVAAVVLALGLV